MRPLYYLVITAFIFITAPSIAEDCNTPLRKASETSYYGVIEAGWAKIGSLKTAIEHFALMSDVEVKIVMHTGLLSRAAEFVATGSTKNVQAFKERVGSFMRNNE